MDSNFEDKMYHQIERSLSNNINEDLFSTGKVFERDKIPILNSTVNQPSASIYDGTVKKQEIIDTIEQDNRNQPPLSRAEYIRQAREACLRQLTAQNAFRVDQSLPMINDETGLASVQKKKKYIKPLEENESLASPLWNPAREKEDASPQEIASFRFLIIRMVCAVVIFLSIFIIDKLDIQIGKLTNDLIKEYVTGKDALQKLEEIVVSWLK